VNHYQKGDLKPHLIRYWLTPPMDEQREETVRAFCMVYQEAPQLAQQGEKTVSTDKLTGVQNQERRHAELPLAPGKVERREFEYIRHSIRSFINSRDVVTGKILVPACGPTRTQADFLAHPQATRWHIVCDRLNTHQSEALVRLSSHNSVESMRSWVSKERAASWPPWRADPPF
jgi:hypothetical protein